jgi:MSHA biogenesis protein MshK
MAGRMMSRGLSVAAAPRWAVSVFCLLISVLSPLHAEDLPDPTRPPASIFAPAAGAGREATENQSSGLHTIIISETRRAAIIDGQTVELGGEHGDAKLIEVNEGGVVLQRAQSRQVLTLFPDVKITQKETPDKESAEKESPNKESPNKEPPNKESLGK